MKTVVPVSQVTGARTPVTLAGVPQGMEALALAEIARESGPLAHVISDGQRIADLEQNLAFFAPDIPVLTLPGWDCLPYDRVSPGADVSARRLSALSALADFSDEPHPAIVLVTVNAMLQRVPPKATVADLGFSARPGNRLKMETLSGRLAQQGFERVDTVREVGEFAVRGGILDVFVPGAEEPVRLDFFGDTLESIRNFDPATQRSTTPSKEFSLNAMSEVTLEPETISRFRRNYLETFGAATRDDALYVAISEGRRYPGMEHWLPLFHDEMATVFDYLGGFRLSGDHMLVEAAGERRAQIIDHFEARQAAQSIEKGKGVQTTPYKAIQPDLLYLDMPELQASLDLRNAIRLTPFHEPENSARRVIDLPTSTGPRWAADAEADASGEGARVNLFDKLGARRHDCLHLEYHGGDRLFLPVENIDLLSRYGSDEAGVNLDKLGGAAWQARKARLKERVREIANQLIKTAAQRELREADVINLPMVCMTSLPPVFPMRKRKTSSTPSTR
jgi:transcription-repair coupling factor (superfamily II helicase)